ncbi:Hypothetical predicted protein [Paramuricea clavata]|uniref:Uncharacterized protein n=1 Tax=Paramuricea clavata TaxID=317549 RepID=A0A7D9E0G2_PARCT|nr:Hypothetical predicted protein [Paramuricea clavata]
MSGLKNPYETLVDRLIHDGIKMVAVDFDLTLVSVHTNGSWMFTARPLASRIRPGFPEFLSEVLRKGLWLAVVTFSPQVDLVRDVLRTVLSEKDMERICIRGNTSDWKPYPSCRKEGKQSHIESAAKYFYKASKMKIKPQEVLLFDDDDENIRVAKTYSMRTVKVVDNTTLPSLLSRDNF